MKKQVAKATSIGSGKKGVKSMPASKPALRVALKAAPKASVNMKPAMRPAKKAGHGIASLTRSQMKDLEEKLASLKEELEASIREKAGVFNTLSYSESVIKGDDAEVAEKQRTNNAALQEIDILKHRLTLVKRAIAKMEAGVYGICEETEEPIGYERLNIVPWARYSIHVQEVRERKLRDFRVSKLQAEY
jgi:DnaK suppressor protein